MNLDTPLPDLRTVEPRPVCVLMVGVPGSGKTTHARELVERMAFGGPVAYICPDDLRLAHCGDASDQSKNGWIFGTALPALMKDAASRGDQIVIDATNVTRKARAPLLELATTLGYRREVHVMVVPLKVCLSRNAARDRIVPPEVIQRMLAQYQEPDLNEGIDSIERHYYQRPVKVVPVADLEAIRDSLGNLCLGYREPTPPDITTAWANEGMVQWRKLNEILS